jgi:two-component system, chemotaxis family, response regulator Rcp1
MRTRNRLRPVDLDAYLAAHRRAYLWAERAMMYRSAGDCPQARVAVDYARHWLHEVESMDAHRPQGRFDSSASKECLNTASQQKLSPAQVLLVEDSPGDVRLMREAFHGVNANVDLHVATDGVEAMNFLRRRGCHINAPRTDLVLLDLNLPRLDGREVLALVKKDSTLKTIPIVVLSTSAAEADINTSYDLRANCYFTKPVDLDDFDDLVKRINDFWIERVKLPRRAHVA